MCSLLPFYVYLYARKSNCKMKIQRNKLTKIHQRQNFCLYGSTDSVVPRLGSYFLRKIYHLRVKFLHIICLTKFHPSKKKKKKRLKNKTKPNTSKKEKETKVYLLTNLSLLSNSAYALDLIFQSLQNI